MCWLGTGYTKLELAYFSNSDPYFFLLSNFNRKSSVLAWKPVDVSAWRMFAKYGCFMAILRREHFYLHKTLNFHQPLEIDKVTV